CAGLGYGSSYALDFW
nr:immunoglobulin heavy chain junction region [Macaca mulatta]